MQGARNMAISVKQHRGLTTDEDVKSLGGRLEFLDGLLQMGEEPYEIEYEVKSLARSAAAAFLSRTVDNRRSTQNLAKELIPFFFEYVYLIHWSRRASLARVTKKALTDFPTLVRIPGVPAEGVEFMVLELLTDFYAFLSQSGYPIDAARFGRAFAQLLPRAMRRVARHHSISDIQSH